ncbi:MAG TPA: ribosomal-processing cysteine protease Prp [Treponemataceae bacterium]|jgi:hypothetical protein|nr:ribosomal-processing cysteine protease Prp [Treponemataceae bacterium]
MIQVKLSLSKDGLLLSCNAEGHACYAPKGKDIVCAGVTTLLKTVLIQLEEKDGLGLHTEKDKRGSLAFRVLSEDLSVHAVFLTYAADFLLRGLQSLEKEYPLHVSVRVVTE